MMLIGAATEHLGRALTVVERVRGELAAHTAKIVDLTAPAPVPDDARTVAASATLPAAPVAPQADVAGRVLSAFAGPSSGPVGSFGSSAGDVAPVAYGSGSYGSGSAVASTESGSAGGSTSYDPRFGGSGVEIVLPDGTTAVAPNEEAADAVRNALTQQGVPYHGAARRPGRVWTAAASPNGLTARPEWNCRGWPRNRASAFRSPRRTSCPATSRCGTATSRW